MGGKKAFSICSMLKGGLSPISVMMSNLTGRSISNRLRYESVDDTIWRILRSVTASCGWPYLSFLLVLTSITMSVWSFSATMSRSFFPSCQSVCLMRYPFFCRKETAAVSPSFPSSLCAAIFFFSAKIRIFVQ